MTHVPDPRELPEPAGFDAWFDRHMPSVLGWCKRLGGPSVDAEDAAADVFEIALRRGRTVADPAAVPAWLFGVTRRVLAAHRRRAWVRRWLPGVAVEGRISVVDEPGSEADELRAELHAAVLGLPERYREVIVLCDLEERSEPEVASLLGVSRETVKTRRRRARDRLRVSLRGYVRSARPFEGAR